MRKIDDPIFMEISWNRIISFVDEAGAALVRTAFSPIIREADDYGVVLFDADGNSLAQSTRSAPSFLGTLPNTMRHFREAMRDEGWNPGDVVITNDPWMGSGHLQDISMVAPIFSRSGRLVAFCGVVAHPPDMGGRWTAENREIYQEGLQLPILKLMKGGAPNKDVFDIIRRNVRVPDQVIGDIHAMIASCAVGADRLSAFMEEVGLESLNELSAAIHKFSEDAIRRRIEAIPDGEYRYAYEIDGYDEPLKIAATLTVRGSDIAMDYTGSSMQVDRAINSPLCYTRSLTIYPLICAINPQVPNNEGMTRAFTITAPPRSILNPEYPAAVGARNLTGHLLTTAVFGTLAQALPKDQIANRLLADSASPRPHLVISGYDDAGDAFSSMFFIAGGMGARPNKDGISCIAFPSSARNTSVEILETSAPIAIQRKAMREGSGGRGKYKGGDGQIFEVRIDAKDGATISIFSDRARFPPQGMNGGAAGAGTVIEVNGKPGPSKGSVRMKQGDVLTVYSPGGGGFGPPV
jgi:N-methylhydantoinase B